MGIRPPVYTLNEVKHCTLDPEGPGVVRLHLKPMDSQKRESLLIINSLHMVPVGHSWATILAILFDELNKYPYGHELSDKEIERIFELVAEKTKKYYPLTTKKRILEDLDSILDICFKIASGDIQPSSVLSFEEMAEQLTSPLRMDLLVQNMEGPRSCLCNCGACYARNQPGIMVENISTDDWKKIIDKLWTAGVPQVTFTGGEPTMRDDLIDLIEYSHRFVTRLNTCGHLLTTEYAQKLREASLDVLQVTLYSIVAETHNRLVGTNGFGKTIAGIKNSLDAGLNVSVNVPLVKANADEFTYTLVQLAEMGVRYISCSGMIPTGGGEAMIDRDKSLTAEDLERVLEKAFRLANKLGVELSFTSPVCHKEVDILDLNIGSVPICGAALSNMAIAPNGAVIPCQSWLDDANGLGNLLWDDWSDIWNHPLAQKLRTNQILAPECLGCDLVTECRGGCPLRLKEEE